MVTCIKNLVTKKVDWIVLQFLVKCIQCLISNKILLFFLTILKLIFLCWNFAMFGVAKKWHSFFKNILVKSPYYEKRKKGRKREYPHFFPTQEIILWKKILYLSEYCLIKLLYFSSSLKPHIQKNPFRKDFNPCVFLTQFFK